jgi:hypothetical protein
MRAHTFSQRLALFKQHRFYGKYCSGTRFRPCCKNPSFASLYPFPVAATRIQYFAGLRQKRHLGPQIYADRLPEKSVVMATASVLEEIE